MDHSGGRTNVSQIRPLEGEVVARVAAGGSVRGVRYHQADVAGPPFLRADANDEAEEPIIGRARGGNRLLANRRAGLNFLVWRIPGRALLQVGL